MDGIVILYCNTIFCFCLLLCINLLVLSNNSNKFQKMFYKYCRVGFTSFTFGCNIRCALNTVQTLKTKGSWMFYLNKSINSIEIPKNLSGIYLSDAFVKSNTLCSVNNTVSVPSTRVTSNDFDLFTTLTVSLLIVKFCKNHTVLHTSEE